MTSALRFSLVRTLVDRTFGQHTRRMFGGSHRCTMLRWIVPPIAVRTIVRVIMPAIVLGSLGCGSSDEVAPLIVDPLMQLDLSARNVLMSTVAPYNTLQLGVTPRTGTGAAVTGTRAPTFLTKDGTLSVTPDGVITALAVTPGSSPTWIAVSVQDTVHDLTITDTVYVTVTDRTPSTLLQTFEVLPTPGDSAKFGIATSSARLPKDTIKVLANADAAFTKQLKIRFRSSDTLAVSVHPSNGSLTLKRPSAAVIEATTTYYGVTKTIHLPITVGLPIAAVVMLDIRSSPTVSGQFIRDFSPNTVTIGVGGTVEFIPRNVATGEAARELPWDLVFDEPLAAERSSLPPNLSQDSSGNVEATPPLVVGGALNSVCLGSIGIRPICNGARRAFRHPGRYTVRSALYGTSATIIVHEEP